jgi:predicted methyltransferase
MRNPRSVALVAVAGLLVGCGGGYDEPVEPAVDPWPLVANIKPAVDDPLRPEEDRARDADRRPAEVLAFFGIGEGMRVADLQATVG